MIVPHEYPWSMMNIPHDYPSSMNMISHEYPSAMMIIPHAYPSSMMLIDHHCRLSLMMLYHRTTLRVIGALGAKGENFFCFLLANGSICVLQGNFFETTIDFIYIKIFICIAFIFFQRRRRNKRRRRRTRRGFSVCVQLGQSLDDRGISWKIRHIYREYNQVADALANEALDVGSLHWTTPPWCHVGWSRMTPRIHANTW